MFQTYYLCMFLVKKSSNSLWLRDNFYKKILVCKGWLDLSELRVTCQHFSPAIYQIRHMVKDSLLILTAKCNCAACWQTRPGHSGVKSFYEAELQKKELIKKSSLQENAIEMPTCIQTGPVLVTLLSRM